jgi:hypothetical protein
MILLYSWSILKEVAPLLINLSFGWTLILAALTSDNYIKGPQDYDLISMNTD